MFEITQRKEIAGRNLVLFNELRKVLVIFNDHHIPVIVLKGAALANTVYDSIGERPMSDVDLLIHLEDRQRIFSILESAGYEFIPHPLVKLHPFNTDLTGESSIRSRNGGIFDLHWELTCNEWMRKYIEVDTDSFWLSAQPLIIEGIETLQLSPVDNLLHICLHLMNDAYSHSIGYNDIAKLIRYYEPFPWDKFVDRAVNARLKTSCYIALELANNNFSAEIPAYVLGKLRPAGLKKWPIHKLLEPIKSSQGDVYYRNKAYLVKLISADGLQDVMKALRFLFTPGPDWLAERYHLNRGIQTWLACIWHPVNIISRGFLSVWEIFLLFIRKLTTRNCEKRSLPGR